MGSNIGFTILNSFQDIFNNKDNLANYTVYYKTLVNWVKQNIDYFTTDIKKQNRLDILLELVPEKYIVDNPEISLDLEIRRIGTREYETIEDLAMTIGDTLWTLVTIRSKKDCPVCDDELRYIIVIDKKTNFKSITLECESCGWTEDIQGNEWKGEISDVYPANKEEVEDVL